MIVVRVDGRKSFTPEQPEKPKIDSRDESPSFSCTSPYEVALNQWFTVQCQTEHGSGTSVNAVNTESVQYDPTRFKIEPGQSKLIKVRIKQSTTGFAPVEFFPDRDYPAFNTVVDVGFKGHLRPFPETLVLAYDTPETISIEVVDENNKPIPLPTSADLRIEAVGAQLSVGKLSTPADYTAWVESIKVPIEPRARASPQFRLKSTAWEGGVIRLSTVLTVSNQVVTQANFSLQVVPVWWLPIALAMSGSLLYWIYSFARKPVVSSAIFPEIIAGIFGGLIAYLFAGYDLLGLKLDPNVLKTYPLLGFLFAYVGIDVLLGNRFRSGEGTRMPEGQDKRLKEANKGENKEEHKASESAAV
jgi:hypothetical protein